MEAGLKTDPKIKVTLKLLCYRGLKLLPWHVGIIWGQCWFAKTRGLTSDHGGQSQMWSWNGGHPKTSMLLILQASRLACGDHLGSVFIWDDLHFRISFESGLHGQIWVLSFWQINTNPKWSPHAKLEVWDLNNIEVLGWPSFQDQSWVWPSWLRTDHGDQTQNWSWNGDHPKWTLTPNDPHM